MSHVDRQPAAGEDTLAQYLDESRGTGGDLSGTTLGDFQVERLLGRGGMGEVYLATQVSLNRPVALKVLRPDVISKPGYKERFEAEAIAVAKLNHPNIVHVYAMAEMGHVHYIAMEYVEGTNLREYVRKRGALDVPQALSVMKQAGQAIGAAGEAGLVHRDVKPENILITRRGRVKVADFGLCRNLDDDGSHLTQIGVTMGTPAYMSPEQAQGHPLDHRSDLYSLGATYYFMIAGVPPFKADSPVALALKQVRELPSSLVVHRPDLPLEIDRLVMKLMAKNPADRYQSAAEMLAELARIREVIQLPGGQQALAADTLDGSPARSGGEERALAPVHEPRGLRLRETGPPEPRARVAGSRAAATALQSAPGAQPQAPAPEPARPTFSALVASVVVMIGLGAGALAGWGARAPDLLSLPAEPARRPPGLWLEPGWAAIAKQPSAEEQFRFAQLQAPHDEWAAAWLAVPGHYPHSHDASSKAFTQLARLWYRRGDVDALEALRAELTSWKDGQQRDKDLADTIELGVGLRKGDVGAVEKGFGKLAESQVSEMYDAASVALNLEICLDALQLIQRSGTQTAAAPLRKAARLLLRQLHVIEVGESFGAARGNAGGGAGPRAKTGAGQAARTRG